jgi:starvation-inducible outer membrane lipoprotein
MKHRIIYSVILLVCFSFILLITGVINSPFSEQKNTKEEQVVEQKNIKEEQQQVASNRIRGKVMDIVNVTGYTYVEVDTGEKKVWAAGPVTSLTIGDMIAFSTEMPMTNFHSKAMERDFPILYFVGRFITDKETPANKAAAIAAPHAQINQQQMAEPAKEINKVEDGNTIAEIYAQKDNLNGKTIRIRGQVTKFTAEIMGKNWLHIRDSSTPDDLTVTTDGTAAINDIVIIEGKLELDKDYGYGYKYPIILEDAKLTQE